MEELTKKESVAVPEKVWLNDVGEINGNYIDKRVKITLKGD